MKILVFANAYTLISGGDVIFAEMSKVWLKSGQEVKIVTNEKGGLFCLKKRISASRITIWKASNSERLGSLFAELYKTITSSFRAIFFKGDIPQVIFAASFFWPDLFSAVLTKIKYPQAKLVVGVYLLFPNPLRKIRYSGGLTKAIILYLSQVISLFLVDRFANIVLTASRHKKELLYNGRQLNERSIVAIRGGVDIKGILRIKNPRKKFACMYFGRFHSQKGLFDLLDIWTEILIKKPNSKFLLAGGGPLEDEIIKKARALGILKSITFSGFVSGAKKYRLLKSAKLFSSASQYDTGNIALDEVLACGVPGIVYDLPYLHYDGGVVKVPVGNKKKMIKKTLELLDTPFQRLRLGKEGRRFIREYDWTKVSLRVLSLFMSPSKK